MSTLVQSQNASVVYRLEIIEADGSARIAQPAKKNLILNSGLNTLGDSSFWVTGFGQAGAIGAAVYGAGTRPTKRDSGTVSFTRAGNTVTASAGFFQLEDVGALLKFDTGAEMYVASFTSATVVTVSTAGALTASEGTIWFVNQTTMDAPLATVTAIRTGETYSAGTHTLSRIATFPTVGATTVVREIGWYATDDNSTILALFGRDLLTAPITLLAGQQLRVTVDLLVQIGPFTPQPYVNAVTGWSANGEQQLLSTQLLSPRFSIGIAVGTYTGAFEINGTSDGSALIANILAGANGYTPGSFTLDRVATFTPDAFSSTGIRSLYVTYGGVPCFRVALDAAEGKTALQSLTLGFRFTWGRVLVN